MTSDDYPVLSVPDTAPVEVSDFSVILGRPDFGWMTIEIIYNG